MELKASGHMATEYWLVKSCADIPDVCIQMKYSRLSIVSVNKVRVYDEAS